MHHLSKQKADLDAKVDEVNSLKASLQQLGEVAAELRGEVESLRTKVYVRAFVYAYVATYVYACI